MQERDARFQGDFMERIFVYFLAVLNIAVGFLILHRSEDRFGPDTCRSFLDREERRIEKKDLHRSERKKVLP